MKKKPQPKTLVVTDTETITPNMQRRTLGNGRAKRRHDQHRGAG